MKVNDYPETHQDILFILNFKKEEHGGQKSLQGAREIGKCLQAHANNSLSLSLVHVYTCTCMKKYGDL